MDKTKTFEMLSVAGLCVGVTLATGCATRYAGNNCSFGGVEGEGANAAVTEIPAGENPMPAALSPVKPADVTYPAPQAPKDKQYWEVHADPYAGMATAPAAASGKTFSGGAPAGYTKYVVKSGDTFGGIAAKNNVSLKSLKAANGGINYDKIKAGQTIYIPGASAASSAAPASSKPGVYVVKNGDILGRIARQYGVKVADLKAANGLKSDTIKVGQKLTIPGKGGAAAAPVAERKPKLAPVKDAAPSAPAQVVPPAPVPPAPVVEVKELDAPPAPAIAAPDIPAQQPVLAPVEATPVAPAPVEMQTHVVKAGEDLYSIAISWSIGVSQLKDANPGVSDPLTEGTVLRIPAK